MNDRHRRGVGTNVLLGMNRETAFGVRKINLIRSRAAGVVRLNAQLILR